MFPQNVSQMQNFQELSNMMSSPGVVAISLTPKKKQWVLALQN